MKKSREIINRIGKDLKEYGWALAGILVCYVLIHAVFDAFCPFLILTGIPCAGCGLTRAFLFLLCGQFQRAVSMNPSVLPVTAFILYFVFFRYILGKRIKGLRACLFVLAVTVLAVYAYRMWKYFPNRIPYVYHESNILSRCVPGYEKFVQWLIKLF